MISAPIWSLPAPQASALLAFELLPSLGLHPTQQARLLPLAAARAHGERLESWHRHWSAALRARCGLEALTDLADPALPFAALPATAFDRLAWLTGAALAGRRLRLCIARADVDLVRREIGDEALDFARYRGPALQSGMLLDEEASLEAIGESVYALGVATLTRLFSSASPAVGGRGLLRLPVPAPEGMASLSLDADASLQLLRAVLAHIDPTWLSSFPVAH